MSQRFLLMNQTGGFLNKIVSVVGNNSPKSLKEIVIFSGLKEKNFHKVLTGKKCGTTVKV
jgi:isopentenyl phosphate kinase